MTKLALVRDQIISCTRCPRLRTYCERVGREKRAAFRNETYWTKPVPGFGDPKAEIVLIGLAPAAHGANRTGRNFTGDGSEITVQITETKDGKLLRQESTQETSVVRK